MDGSLSNPFAHQAHHHQQASSHDSTASSNLSPRSLTRPSASLFAHGLPVPHQHLHQHQAGGARSPANMNAALYPPPYATSSASPSTGSGSLQEHNMHADGPFKGPGISPTHLSAQKRAYRQRRKDPSCDACRERKVKCDATETSSCSECHQRGVKCQFTKETNRRMSSIKQVQDLQSQLAEAKETISQMTTDLQRNDRQHEILRPGGQYAPHLPDLNPTMDRRRRSRLSTVGNFAHVQKNVRIWGHGIFKPPVHLRQGVPNISYPGATPGLPDRQLADRLLGQYYGSVHGFAPVLSFSTFLPEYEALYSQGFRNYSHVWIALFFGVLGCGSLQSAAPTFTFGQQEDDGRIFIKIAMSALSNGWMDDFQADHARVALLVSIYLHETGHRSAAAIWLSSAVRIAVDLGLHLEQDFSQPHAQEQSRRTWFAIYTWDRLQALETNRPLLISDDDCDLGWPTSTDRLEDPLEFGNAIRGTTPHHDEPMVTYWNHRITFNVVRCIGEVRRALKNRVLAPKVLQSYNDYFRDMVLGFPAPFQPTSVDPIQTSSIFPILGFQILQFYLYRQNLGPTSTSAERKAAVDRCLDISHQTTSYLRRLQSDTSRGSDPRRYPNPHFARWECRFAAISSSLLCTHLWRCALVLCLRCEFESAIACVKACAATGDMRPVNIACGRNLTFFIQILSDKIAEGRIPQENFDSEDDLLAYLSADMQSNMETAWIWTGSDIPNTKSFGPTSDSPIDSAHPMPNLRPSALLNETHLKDWKGWDHIEKLLMGLSESKVASYTQLPPPPLPLNPHSQPNLQTLPPMQQHSPHVPSLQPPTPRYFAPPHNAHKRLQLDPSNPAISSSASNTNKQELPSNSTPSPGSTSRMSIANIV